MLRKILKDINGIQRKILEKDAADEIVFMP